MSSLPSGWVETALGEVCHINPSLGGEVSDESECSFIPMAAVGEESGCIDTSQRRQFGELRRKSYRPFRDGDVLVAKITPSMENGKGAVAEHLENGVGFGSTEFHVLRPLGGLDPTYVLRYLLQPRFRAEARRHMTGTAGQLRVPASFLRDVSLPLPPLNEQRRIVAAIEEQFSRLDAAEESLRQARLKAARLRASILEAAAPTDAPLKRVSDLVEVGRKLAYGVLQPGGHLEDGVPFVRVGDIVGGRVETSDLKRIAPAIANAYPRTRLRGGEVLVTLVGTIGRTAVAPESLRGANVARAVGVIPVAEYVNADYISIALGRPSSARQLGALAHEVARKTLNLGDVREFAIPVPSIDEQGRIVAEVAQQVSLIDAIHKAIDAAERRSAALRRSILERAFRGEFVPQDPDDESASVLLARIASDRAAITPKRRAKVPG